MRSIETVMRGRDDRANHRRPRRGLLVAVLAATFLAIAPSIERVDAVPPWRQEVPERERPLTVTIGGQVLAVEVADESPEQSLGLGQRDGLVPGTGMLFQFPEARAKSFWMFGMRFCLDIIWIDGDEVIGAAESVCPSPAGTTTSALPSFASPGPVDRVLEVPAGFMAEHGVRAGDLIEVGPAGEPAG